MPSWAEVVEFLKGFKARANESGLEFRDRDKNIAELAYHGFHTHQVIQIINQLTPRSYSQGPMQDEDGTQGNVWVFGVILESQQIYIKLKLTTEAECISFHRAEREMRFPFA